MFDMAEVQSKLIKLLELYSENLLRVSDQARLETEDFIPDASPYFDGMKDILLFFCSEDCMDTFGENNTAAINKVLDHPRVSRSDDFVIFLHAVVRADLANESEVEGESQGARQVRVKKERYGNLTNINRFSLTHIEWLADALPSMADLL